MNTLKIEVVERLIGSIRLRITGTIECPKWRKYAGCDIGEAFMCVSPDCFVGGKETGEWSVSSFGGGNVWPKAFPSLFTKWRGKEVLAPHVREIAKSA